MTRTRILLHLVAILVSCGLVHAESLTSITPVEDKSDDYQVEVLLTGLDNPAGIAFRPTRDSGETFELYLAESGAGRVLRVHSDPEEDPLTVISGFTVSQSALEPGYRFGPLGLAFFSRAKLIVGDCGGEPGADQLAVFVLLNEPAVLEAKETDHTVGPLRIGDDSVGEEFQFFSMALADQAVYLTSGATSMQSLILKAGGEANRLEYLQVLVDTDRISGVSSPGGIAVLPSPRPPLLVVATMGSFDQPRDSLLTFSLPRTGELVLSLITGLHDIIGLAYSDSGQLYALDVAWTEEESGGVYRLDDVRVDGVQACRAVKIASVVKPISLQFAPDGTLFVTALGAGVNDKQGMLIRVTGDF